MFCVFHLVTQPINNNNANSGGNIKFIACRVFPEILSHWKKIHFYCNILETSKLWEFNTRTKMRLQNYGREMVGTDPTRKSHQKGIWIIPIWHGEIMLPYSEFTNNTCIMKLLYILPCVGYNKLFNYICYYNVCFGRSACSY